MLRQAIMAHAINALGSLVDCPQKPDGELLFLLNDTNRLLHIL